ncbi:MAG: KH domain-containing protein [Calditrichaeota bacterium]|nr:KH domain-containing protein [Calditrichota bacterium]MCB9366396.1 KH domain-containing protein [Calditrichota bacterium]
MEDFISFIVKHLVEKPEAVRIEKLTEDSGRVLYKLYVGDGDLGQVIGKEGRTARSLRTLVFAAAARKGIRAGFEIVDPALPPKGAEPPHLDVIGSSGERA